MASTIAADLDGNGIKAFYSHQSADEVVAALKEDGWISVDDYRIPAASVKYVQVGRKSLPVSSAPSSNAMAEHAAIVSGVHQ